MAFTKSSVLSIGHGGRFKIGFVGLCAGAGATTLAFSAAEYLAAREGKTGRKVAFLELSPRSDFPAGFAYDKIGIDRRFAGREFLPIHKIASEGKPLKGIENIDGGINWALRIPGEPGPAPTVASLFRLLNNVPGDIIVCDVSSYSFFGRSGGHDDLIALLADFDRIYCILDPLPSRLLASVPAAGACRAVSSAGTNTFWVFNKLNPGADMREAVRFTGVKDFLAFPAIPAEIIYKAEYACRSLVSSPAAQSALLSMLG